MTNNPDDIRREIEDTRGRLSNDVNALTETVSPSNVARRQADKVAGVATSVKERVMGTADDLRSTGGLGSSMLAGGEICLSPVGRASGGQRTMPRVVGLGLAWWVQLCRGGG